MSKDQCESLGERAEKYGPCSCQDSGKCKYIDGSPACMQEECDHEYADSLKGDGKIYG